MDPSFRSSLYLMIRHVQVCSQPSVFAALIDPLQSRAVVGLCSSHDVIRAFRI